MTNKAEMTNAQYNAEMKRIEADPLLKAFFDYMCHMTDFLAILAFYAEDLDSEIPAIDAISDFIRETTYSFERMVKATKVLSVQVSEMDEYERAELLIEQFKDTLSEIRSRYEEQKEQDDDDA